MSPSHYPRPENPPPHRQRGTVEGTDWINLNGPWDFRFDGERTGITDRWFDSDWQGRQEQILVPFCWESLAAWGQGNAAGNENYYSKRVFRNPVDVTDANHRDAPSYEVGWYRRSLHIPSAWNGKRIILTIGAADFFTDCWCNGLHLGHHEGGYDPFEFDLTDALDSTGNADLVLRVEDPMDNREQPVGKQWEWYTPTSGIWQTVFVEPRSREHIEEFRIRTEISTETAWFEVVCEGAPENAVVQLEIHSPDDAIQRAQFLIAGNQAAGGVELKPFHLWDPCDPKLYHVTFRLMDRERELDRVRGYFGVREITTAPVETAGAPAALILNGRPIYLRGALYQSYHPDGVYTATDAKVLRDDIAYAKSVGFDFLRIHIKVDDPLVLYFADTVGMMLMCDFPNFGEGGDTPIGRSRYEVMMRAAIRRDFNHPSIIAWCTFNETWGFGGQVELVKFLGKTAAEIDEMFRAGIQETKLSNESAHEWVQSMWELAKSLDPTRLVEDMSVVPWNHLAYFGHGDTDINSWHFYTHDYAWAREHIARVVKETYAGSSFHFVSGYQQSGQPLINSEYGGIGALDGDRDVSWSFKFLTNELRRHGSLSAYIYTELHDVEWEYNGFLNYDRTRKEFGYDPLMINQGDVLPVDAPPIRECAPGEKISVPVSSSHFSRTPSGPVALHWRLAGVDAQGNVHQNLVVGSVPIAFPQFRVAPAHTIEFHMPLVPMLCTLWMHAIDAHGKTLASNYVQFFCPVAEEQSREESESSIILRPSHSEWSESKWTESAVDRRDAVHTGYFSAYRTGYAEWQCSISEQELMDASRIRIVCEASSRGIGNPQTDGQRQPTTLQITANGVLVFHSILPGHPHDSRGSLSYLRGGRGAYGYLVYAIAEGDLLEKIRTNTDGNGILRIRCAVPSDAIPQEGLTIYGTRCGRYPFGLTVIVDRPARSFTALPPSFGEAHSHPEYEGR